MPFKSKKQKRTIDAAAHNPAFAKKVGISVADAKKMSAHGKGQTKFQEERTEVKDKDGNVTSWKDESDWRPVKDSKKIATPGKFGAGRSTAKKLAGDAAAQTKKMSKAEENMINDFESFISEADMIDHPRNWAPIDRRLPQAAQDAEYGRRLQWYRDNQPDAFNTMQPNDMVKWKLKPGEKTIPLPSDPDDGILNQKRPVRQAPIKKSDATDMMGNPTQTAVGGEEDQMANMAEAAYSAKAGRAGKDLGKKGKNFSKISKSAGGGEKGDAIAGKVLKDIRKKNLKESILAIQQMIAEAKKKEMKCDECGMWESKCSCDHTNESVKAKKEKEPEGLYSSKRFETDSQRVARLAKEKMQAKKKAEQKTTEGNDGNLANNAKPYDKVTRGDVIAGRLGKDEMGGKKKEKKTTEGNDGNLANNAKPYDKVTRGDVIAGRLGKDEMGGKKKKVKESYSKEQLAGRLFEHEDDQMADDESSMSKAELLEIAKNAMAIFRMIKDGENLDAWVAEYIGIANDHLNSIAEQMNGEEATQEVSPEDEYMESLRQHLNSLKG